MKSSLFIPLFFTLLALATAGCGDKTETGTGNTKSIRPVPVSVGLAQPASQPIFYEAVGTVQAQETAAVSGKLLVSVQTIMVREGDAVKAGDILVRLDERQVDAQFRQAEAALAQTREAEAAASASRDSAEAGAVQAAIEYRRHKILLESGATSRQQFDAAEARHKQAAAALSQAEAALAAAKRGVQQAEAALAAARVTRSDAQVTAPFDGRVSGKLVDEGDLAIPGAPLLVVEKAGPYRVDFLVPEAHIQGVETGQTVAVHITAAAANPIDGKVSVVVPSADEATRTFLVKVELPTHPMVRSGMFARVFLPVGNENIVLIPQTALVVHGQLTGVFLVERDHVARYRLVRVGRTVGGKVEVLSGLKPGASFVIEPGPTLVNGTSVEPRA